MANLAVQRTHERRSVRDLRIVDGAYTVRLAETIEEVESALRLRFEVFNLELNEGLEGSYINGLDEDAFDATSDHLIIVENATGRTVGTYRLRTLDMSERVSGFYCATEFEIEKLPLDLLQNSVEIGRASIAIDHRNSKALFLLWKGLLTYLGIARKRYLFGSCSLTSQDEHEGIQALTHLLRTNAAHDEYWVNARSSFACRVNDTLIANEDYKLPKLFSAYLRFGAKVCSSPAIDRDFKTIDFLVMFDIQSLSERHLRLFDL